VFISVLFVTLKQSTIKLMQSIITVYLAYIWVGLLHALFVGVTLYSFLGTWFKKKHQFIPIALIFMILAFFELYWIPMFNTLGVQIYIHDTAVQQHFGIDANTNLVAALHPTYISYFFWVVTTYLGYKIGNYSYKIHNS
jgi:hypothetical protein